MSVVGVGIDLVDIGRVERMLQRHPDRLPRHLLTADEWEYCRRKAHPAQHVAVRIAAKEAAFKALAGNELARRVSWRHLEVVADRASAPELRFHGPAVERADELDVGCALLSLTHSEATAGAVVILTPA